MKDWKTDGDGGGGGEYDDNGRRIQFDDEIDVVDGERGRLLAIEQANSILEVLEWFGRHANPPTR